MKRIFLLLTIFFFVCSSVLAATGYYRTGLTGGTSDDLDAISESTAADDDLAWVSSGDNLYIYRYESSSALAENSPTVITPDDTTGNGRWLLQTNYLDVSDYTKRNRVINSEGMIDQRNEGTVVTTSGSYIVDRFRMLWADTDELDIDAQQSTGIGGYRNSIKVTADVAEADWVDTSEYVAPFQYRILGYDVADLVNGADVTISFYFMSNHPNNSVFSVALRAGDVGYSYVTDFTYTTTATAQLVTKTITIPAHASNYVSNTTTGVGMDILIAAYAGTDFQGTADQWNSANDMCSASATDWTQAIAGPTDGYVQISGLQFRVGDEYIPLDMKSRSEYLAESLPYGWNPFYENTVADADIVGRGLGYDTTSCFVLIKYPVPMVGTPSLTVSNVAHFDLFGEIAVSAIALSTANSRPQQEAVIDATSVGLSAGETYDLMINSASATMFFDAEI